MKEDNQWQFKFQVKSQSSDKMYTISQHKEQKHWACSCKGWTTRRYCKHLDALDLPGGQVPYLTDEKEAEEFALKENAKLVASLLKGEKKNAFFENFGIMIPQNSLQIQRPNQIIKIKHIDP